MKKQLAEVVDGTEIKEITEQEILYSYENNGANDLCSTKKDATCGDGCTFIQRKEKGISC